MTKLTIEDLNEMFEDGVITDLQYFEYLWRIMDSKS